MTTQSIPAVPQGSASGSLTLHRTPLPALTGIRFVAAIQVVLFHFGADFAVSCPKWVRAAFARWNPDHASVSA